jgi:hypothetical protein
MFSAENGTGGFIANTVNHIYLRIEIATIHLAGESLEPRILFNN